MEAEVIDLTKSPPSSPENPYNKSSRILKFTAYIYSRKIRFKVKKSCLPFLTFNPNPTNLGTSLISQATDQPMNEDPWTPKEHEEFLMGLRKYGGGRRNKILKDFVKNKTGRQVEKHATSFLINFLRTYLNSCAPAIACNNNNKTDLMATLASALNPNPKNNQMKEEEEEDTGPPPTLIPFSNGEAGCSRDVISEVANTTRSCVNVDDDDEGEVDLELRLGCNNRY